MSKDHRTIHIAVYVEQSLKDRIAEHAEKQDLSISTYIRKLIKEHLNQKDN